MTVKELREILSQYDDDTVVVVDGYEDGFDDPTPRLGYAVLRPGDGNVWWSGRHKNAEFAPEGATEVLVLSRRGTASETPSS
jgi:hypothetical protein